MMLFVLGFVAGLVVSKVVRALWQRTEVPQYALLLERDQMYMLQNLAVRIGVWAPQALTDTYVLFLRWVVEQKEQKRFICAIDEVNGICHEPHVPYFGRQIDIAEELTPTTLH